MKYFHISPSGPWPIISIYLLKRGGSGSRKVIRFTSRPRRKQLQGKPRRPAFPASCSGSQTEQGLLSPGRLVRTRIPKSTSRVPEPAGLGCVEAFAFRQIPWWCRCCWSGDHRRRTARTCHESRPALFAYPALQTQLDFIKWKRCGKTQRRRLVTSLPLAPQWSWAEQKPSLLTVPLHTSTSSPVSKDSSPRRSDISPTWGFEGFKVFSEILLSSVSINGSFWSS